MKRQLDELLDANLQKINHISENKHFIGFSKRLIVYNILCKQKSQEEL